MQERVINRPLSGTEIQEAILSKIKDAFQKDCRLAPHVAYGAFKFSASIHIEFPQDMSANNNGTNAAVSGGEGEVDAMAETEATDVKVSDSEKPPNQVRVETGQGVPVVVKGKGGKIEEKTITYRSPSFTKEKK